MIIISKIICLINADTKMINRTSLTVTSIANRFNVELQKFLIFFIIVFINNAFVFANTTALLYFSCQTLDPLKLVL